MILRAACGARQTVGPASATPSVGALYSHVSRLTAADMQRAIGDFEEATAKDPSFGDAHAGLAQAYVMRAAAMGGGLDQAARRAMLARDHARLGNVDEAFAALDRAYQRRQSMLNLLRSLPWYEPLRGDPRFADLSRRLGLPERK